MRAPLLATLLAMTGCTGAIGGEGFGGTGTDSTGTEDPPGTTTPRPPAGGSGDSPAVPVSPTAPPPVVPQSPPNMRPPAATGAGPMPLRRLTPREYNNTVRDLLGDTSRPADQFPPGKNGGFIFELPGTVATQDAILLRTAAESVAASAGKRLAMLVPCDPARGDDACARAFVQGFGLRAWRRPLAPADVDRLMGLYTTARTTLMLGFSDAIVFVIEGVLQSAEFLYHREEAPGPAVKEGTLVKLGPYQVASRLSYFLWGSMPDQALFDAAAAGKLGTEAEIEAHARRMLASPAARETVSAFFEDWMGLDELDAHPKDPKVYPEYTEALQAAMVAEVRAYVQSVVFDGAGSWSALLTSSFGYVNQALAAIYGISTVKGTEMRRLDLDPAQRQGLLTQASFLALTGAQDGSNPSRRGRAVLEQVLCRELPPPPPNVPDVRPPMAGLTTRQRFAEHANMDCARGCHGLIDPIGFAFEHYDGIGRYRTTDASKPVDATGSITLDGAEKRFDDALGLNRALAASAEVQRCQATQWLRFALLRPETDADSGSVDAGLLAMNARSGNVRELLVALATSKSFRYRAPSAGEVLP